MALQTTTTAHKAARYTFLFNQSSRLCLFMMRLNVDDIWGFIVLICLLLIPSIPKWFHQKLRYRNLYVNSLHSFFMPHILNSGEKIRKVWKSAGLWANFSKITFFIEFEFRFLLNSFYGKFYLKIVNFKFDWI